MGREQSGTVGYCAGRDGNGFQFHCNSRKRDGNAFTATGRDMTGYDYFIPVSLSSVSQSFVLTPSTVSSRESLISSLTDL